MKRIRNNNQGFTLIEVMIALSIFAIGLLAVASMQISSINGNASSRGSIEASEWASRWLEKLSKVEEYNSDQLAPETEFTDEPVDEDTETRYEVNWNVLEAAPSSSVVTYNFKVISVTVEWKERSLPRRLEMRYVKPIILGS